MLVTRAPTASRQPTQASSKTSGSGSTGRSDTRRRPPGALADIGCAGKKFGVEYETWGLTAANGRRQGAALSGFCATEDVRPIPALRVVKSEAEIAYVRRAAELGDEALDEAHRLAGPGVDESEILAAMQGAVFKGGGDYPGNEFIIGSGRDALLCRYFTGRRRLDAQDQLTLEFAGAYRHHACLMRTIPIGEADPRQVDMHKVAVDAGPPGRAPAGRAGGGGF